MRRAIIVGAIALFMVASALTALRLNAGGADGPVQQVSHPSSDLFLTETLDHRRLGPNGALHLQVELKNVGSRPVPIPAGGICRPALQVLIKDSYDQIVWAQPLPMCAEIYPPKQQLLYAGQSVVGAFCWQLGRASSTECAFLDLPSGSYHAAGTFYGFPLPEVAFRVSR